MSEPNGHTVEKDVPACPTCGHAAHMTGWCEHDAHPACDCPTDTVEKDVGGAHTGCGGCGAPTARGADHRPDCPRVTPPESGRQDQ